MLNVRPDDCLQNVCFVFLIISVLIHGSVNSVTICLLLENLKTIRVTFILWQQWSVYVVRQQTIVTDEYNIIEIVDGSND